MLMSRLRTDGQTESEDRARILKQNSQFWQLRTWIHDYLCDLTIKSDTGQHSQFLRCFSPKVSIPEVKIGVLKNLLMFGEKYVPQRLRLSGGQGVWWKFKQKQMFSWTILIKTTISLCNIKPKPNMRRRIFNKQKTHNWTKQKPIYTACVRIPYSMNCCLSEKGAKSCRPNESKNGWLTPFDEPATIAGTWCIWSFCFDYYLSCE